MAAHDLQNKSALVAVKEGEKSDKINTHDHSTLPKSKSGQAHGYKANKDE